MINETLNVIKSLRSTHWTFSGKPVSREDVETIIEHSLHPANNNDRTDTSVIVVDDPELLNAISFGELQGKSVTTLVYLLDRTRLIQCARVRWGIMIICRLTAFMTSYTACTMFLPLYPLPSLPQNPWASLHLLPISCIDMIL